jgi:hypothetical protein
LATYTLLIYRNAPAHVRLPVAEDEGLSAHRALQQEAAGQGDLLAVARLDSTSKARTVRRQRVGHEITDGPFMETKEWLVGFYLIECASEEQALARAKQICRDEHHLIEVRPVDWRWRPAAP